MENNTQFRITYYSNKDKKHIIRKGTHKDIELQKAVGK